MEQKKQIRVTNIRNSKPTPRLESTTPAVRTSGATVELEPGCVSGSGREESQTVLQYYGCTGMVILCIQN